MWLHGGMHRMCSSGVPQPVLGARDKRFPSGEPQAFVRLLGHPTLLFQPHCRRASDNPPQTIRLRRPASCPDWLCAG